MRAQWEEPNSEFIAQKGPLPSRSLSAFQMDCPSPSLLCELSAVNALRPLSTHFRCVCVCVCLVG